MKFKSLVSNLRLVLMPDSANVVNGIVIKDSGVTLAFERNEFDVDKFIARIEIEKPQLVDTVEKKKAFIEAVVNRLKNCTDALAGKVWEYKVLTAEERAEALKRQFDAQFDAMSDEDRVKFVNKFTQNIPGVSVRHIDTGIVEVIKPQAVIAKPESAPKFDILEKPVNKAGKK